MKRLVFGFAAFLCACASGQAETRQGAPSAPRVEVAAQVEPAPKAEAKPILGPEISRSRGEEGGVVLLYPRIIPSSERERLAGPAGALQARMRELIAAERPGVAIDVRPAPERVCPRAGCLGTSVGVLIAVQEDNCVAVAMVSAPGQSPQRLIPWAGVVTGAESAPFREPPESFLTIREFVPCEALLKASFEHEVALKAALRKR